MQSIANMILLHHNFSKAIREQQLVNLSFEYWRNFTCLEFEQHDDQYFQNRILFRRGANCETYVGKQGRSTQDLFVTEDCFRMFGGVVHEIGHALGLCHEHSRPDRNDHVEILYQNMEENAHAAFESLSDFTGDTLGLPYDFGSIMHYSSHAYGKKPFGILPQKQTIRTLKQAYQLTMGNRQQISFYDMKAVNLLYCSDRCIGVSLPCQRGGIVNTRTCDSCWCPDGFAGRYCEALMPHKGRPCGGRVYLAAERNSRISTPGWPNKLFSSLPKGQECFWLITAPAGKIIRMHIIGSSPLLHSVKFVVTSSFLFDIGRSFSFCIDYVEVKNSSDLANTGMRFCGDIPPAGPIYSETNEMMVIFRANRYSTRGFGANLYPISPENKTNVELLVHDFFGVWSTYDY